MARSETSARTSWFLTVASLCVVVAGLYFAREVLIPLALAVMLTFVLAPLVKRVERLRAGRLASVLIVGLLAFSLLGVLGWVVANQLYELASNLDKYRDNISAKVESVRPRSAFVEKLTRTADVVQKKLNAPATSQASTRATVALQPPVVVPPVTQSAGAPVPVIVVAAQHSPLERIWQYLGFALGPLGTAGLVAVFVLFMLLQHEDLRDRLIRLVGYGQLTVTTQAIDDATGRISRYLLMQAIVNGTYGTTVGLGLWVIGHAVGGGNPPFPNVVLWGLLCGVLRFLPYVGPWIGASFPLLISLAVYHGWGVFLWTAGLFAAIEVLTFNVFEPLLYGTSTGLSTVAILASAVFWTWLWGPIGLLLATPLTVCVVVIGKHVPQLRFLDIMLGDQPVLAPHERVYQRWLAMDHEEVAELVHGFLKTSSLEEVYDSVLLPALALAEQDQHRGLLDDERRKFMRRSLRDLIDELGDEQQVIFARTGAGPAERPEESRDGAKPRMRLPAECVVNVLALPAHDEADEIAGLMLTQLLSFAGYCAKNVSTEALAGEMVEHVTEHQAQIVVVSAVPPDAVTHARYICKRLAMAHPEMDLVIGLWTLRGDLKRAGERIGCAAAVRMVTSLSQALDAIEQMTHQFVVKGQEGAAAVR